MLVSIRVMNKVFTLAGFYLVLTKVVEILDTIQCTFYSATSFLEKCRKVVLDRAVARSKNLGGLY